MIDLQQGDALEVLKCPGCGIVAEANAFDCIGACDGNVFCTHCHQEFDQETGRKHRLGYCCVETIYGKSSDKQQNKLLLAEMRRLAAP